MEAKEGSIAGFQQHIGRITRSRSRANGVPLPPIPPNKNKPLRSKRKSTKGVPDENSLQIPVSSNLASDVKGQQKGRPKRAPLAEIKSKCNVSSDVGGGSKKGRGKRPASASASASDDATHNGVGVGVATTLVLPNKRHAAALRQVPNIAPPTESQSAIPQAASPEYPLEHDKPNVDDFRLNDNMFKQVASSAGHFNKDRESIATFFLEESSCGPHAFPMNADTINGDTTSSGIVNIDCDKSNTRMCSIYASDMYNNYRANERIRRPSSDFMERLQTDITQNMRAILVDWLVEVCDEYCLVPDTLYLTVYLIDRFLSMRKIERQRLQLLGVTCMLIASKYEEICAPRVQEFCFITDNSYGKAEVLKMETEVLSLVGYNICVPTIKIFLRRFVRAAQGCCKAPAMVMHLANYLAELTLVEYSFLKFMPSVIASSAVFLAQWTIDQSTNPWNNTLQHYTGYNSSQLKDAVLALRHLQTNTKHCTLKAIRLKYQHHKFSSVASLTSPQLPHSLFS